MSGRNNSKDTTQQTTGRRVTRSTALKAQVPGLVKVKTPEKAKLEDPKGGKGLMGKSKISFSFMKKRLQTSLVQYSDHDDSESEDGAGGDNAAPAVVKEGSDPNRDNSKQQVKPEEKMMDTVELPAQLKPSRDLSPPAKDGSSTSKRSRRSLSPGRRSSPGRKRSSRRSSSPRRTSRRSSSPRRSSPGRRHSSRRSPSPRRSPSSRRRRSRRQSSSPKRESRSTRRSPTPPHRKRSPTPPHRESPESKWSRRSSSPRSPSPVPRRLASTIRRATPPPRQETPPPADTLTSPSHLTSPRQLSPTPRTASPAPPTQITQSPALVSPPPRKQTPSPTRQSAPPRKTSKKVKSPTRRDSSPVIVDLTFLRRDSPPRKDSPQRKTLSSPKRHSSLPRRDSPPPRNSSPPRRASPSPTRESSPRMSRRESPTSRWDSPPSRTSRRSSHSPRTYRKDFSPTRTSLKDSSPPRRRAGRRASTPEPLDNVERRTRSQIRRDSEEAEPSKVPQIQDTKDRTPEVTMAPSFALEDIPLPSIPLPNLPSPIKPAHSHPIVVLSKSDIVVSPTKSHSPPKPVKFLDTAVKEPPRDVEPVRKPIKMIEKPVSKPIKLVEKVGSRAVSKPIRLDDEPVDLTLDDDVILLEEIPPLPPPPPTQHKPPPPPPPKPTKVQFNVKSIRRGLAGLKTAMKQSKEALSPFQGATESVAESDETRTDTERSASVEKMELDLELEKHKQSFKVLPESSVFATGIPVHQPAGEETERKPIVEPKHTPLASPAISAKDSKDNVSKKPDKFSENKAAAIMEPVGIVTEIKLFDKPLKSGPEEIKRKEMKFSISSPKFFERESIFPAEDLESLSPKECESPAKKGKFVKEEIPLVKKEPKDIAKSLKLSIKEPKSSNKPAPQTLPVSETKPSADVEPAVVEPALPLEEPRKGWKLCLKEAKRFAKDSEPHKKTGKDTKSSCEDSSINQEGLKSPEKENSTSPIKDTKAIAKSLKLSIKEPKSSSAGREVLSESKSVVREIPLPQPQEVEPPASGDHSVVDMDISPADSYSDDPIPDNIVTAETKHSKPKQSQDDIAKIKEQISFDVDFLMKKVHLKGAETIEREKAMAASRKHEVESTQPMEIRKITLEPAKPTETRKITLEPSKTRDSVKTSVVAEIEPVFVPEGPELPPKAHKRDGAPPKSVGAQEKSTTSSSSGSSSDSSSDGSSSSSSSSSSESEEEAPKQAPGKLSPKTSKSEKVPEAKGGSLSVMKALEPKLKALEPKLKALEPKLKALEPKLKVLEPKLKAFEPEKLSVASAGEVCDSMYSPSKPTGLYSPSRPTDEDLEDTKSQPPTRQRQPNKPKIQHVVVVKKKPSQEERKPVDEKKHSEVEEPKMVVKKQQIVPEEQKAPKEPKAPKLSEEVPMEVGLTETSGKEEKKIARKKKESLKVGTGKPSSSSSDSEGSSGSSSSGEGSSSDSGSSSESEEVIPSEPLKPTETREQRILKLNRKIEKIQRQMEQQLPKRRAMQKQMEEERLREEKEDKRKEEEEEKNQLPESVHHVSGSDSVDVVKEVSKKPSRCTLKETTAVVQAQSTSDESPSVSEKEQRDARKVSRWGPVEDHDPWGPDQLPPDLADDCPQTQLCDSTEHIPPPVVTPERSSILPTTDTAGFTLLMEAAQTDVLMEAAQTGVVPLMQLDVKPVPTTTTTDASRPANDTEVWNSLDGKKDGNIVSLPEALPAIGLVAYEDSDGTRTETELDKSQDEVRLEESKPRDEKQRDQGRSRRQHSREEERDTKSSRERDRERRHEERSRRFRRSRSRDRKSRSRDRRSRSRDRRSRSRDRRSRSRGRDWRTRDAERRSHSRDRDRRPRERRSRSKDQRSRSRDKVTSKERDRMSRSRERDRRSRSREPRSRDRDRRSRSHDRRSRSRDRDRRSRSRDRWPTHGELPMAWGRRSRSRDRYRRDYDRRDRYTRRRSLSRDRDDRRRSGDRRDRDRRSASRSREDRRDQRSTSRSRDDTHTRRDHPPVGLELDAIPLPTPGFGLTETQPFPVAKPGPEFPQTYGSPSTTPHPLPPVKPGLLPTPTELPFSPNRLPPIIPQGPPPPVIGQGLSSMVLQGPPTPQRHVGLGMPPAGHPTDSTPPIIPHGLSSVPQPSLVPSGHPASSHIAALSDIATFEPNIPPATPHMPPVPFDQAPAKDTFKPSTILTPPYESSPHHQSKSATSTTGQRGPSNLIYPPTIDMADSDSIESVEMELANSPEDTDARPISVIGEKPKPKTPEKGPGRVAFSMKTVKSLSRHTLEAFGEETAVKKISLPDIADRTLTLEGDLLQPGKPDNSLAGASETKEAVNKTAEERIPSAREVLAMAFSATKPITDVGMIPLPQLPSIPEPTPRPVEADSSVALTPVVTDVGASIATQPTPPNPPLPASIQSLLVSGGLGVDISSVEEGETKLPEADRPMPEDLGGDDSKDSTEVGQDKGEDDTPCSRRRSSRIRSLEIRNQSQKEDTPPKDAKKKKVPTATLR